MTAQVKLWLIGAALVLVSGSYLYWRTQEREKGALAFANAGLTKENTSLRGQVAFDSLALLKRDTVKLFAKIDTGHTIIQRLIDTAHVYHTDTVKITVEKLVTIDSTIKACRVTVSDCATLANDRLKRINVLDSLLKVTGAQQPGFLQRRAAVTVGYGCGEAAGKLACGPGVMAGIRVWP